MFEFEQTDYALAPSLATAWTGPARSEFPRARISSYSLQNWGEHCTECGFPSCYQTCSFYSPRQDRRCRRFTFGILKVPSPHSWMGYAAFVEFKNWSTFWAQGNATQLPPALSAMLQAGEAAAWALAAPIDRVLQKVTGGRRLSLVLQSLRRRTFKGIGTLYAHFPKPDCFLLEIYNPMATDTQVRLWMRNTDGTPARFEWAGVATRGLTSFPIAVADIERWIDLSRSFDMGFTVSDEADKSLFVSSASFVRLAARPQPVAQAAPVAASRPKVKCLVWDLDHTLWDGVLVESATTPQLKDGIRSVLDALDRRGILLSIASKNSEADVRQALVSLGLWDMFLAPQIGWQPKSESLKRIAQQLNIGIDSLALIDDMPFERDEITASVPAQVIPAEDYLSILGRPEFAGDASREGASRRLMMQTDLTRQQALADSKLDYEAFLASCNIRVSIERPGDEMLPRIDDIVQRTNQLNIATQRYSHDELRRMIHGSDCDCFVVSCSDRYGVYGHVGFIVVTRTAERMLIRDCMFSCRIQGKRIDQAVLASIINHYLLEGVTSVQARFVATARNAPAGEMLRRLGFEPSGSDGLLALPAARPRDEVAYVQIDGAIAATSCSLS
jgi:FkbH-like protein